LSDFIYSCIIYELKANPFYNFNANNPLLNTSTPNSISGPSPIETNWNTSPYNATQTYGKELVDLKSYLLPNGQNQHACASVERFRSVLTSHRNSPYSTGSHHYHQHQQGHLNTQNQYSNVNYNENESTSSLSSTSSSSRQHSSSPSSTSSSSSSSSSSSNASLSSALNNLSTPTSK
jgi:cell wall integrity and stress response component